MTHRFPAPFPASGGGGGGVLSVRRRRRRLARAEPAGVPPTREIFLAQERVYRWDDKLSVFGPSLLVGKCRSSR